MAKSKQRQGARRSLLMREICVLGVEPFVSTRAESVRGGGAFVESGSWINIEGELDEAVRGQCLAAISVHLATSDEVGTSMPPSIGAIINLRPRLHAVVSIPGTEFDHIWTMANTGTLKYCVLVFTEPFRRSALVTNAQFSNRSQNEA